MQTIIKHDLPLVKKVIVMGILLSFRVVAYDLPSRQCLRLFRANSVFCPCRNLLPGNHLGQSLRDPSKIIVRTA